ncbi:hypothetical protein CCACVL1_31057 [Corchorus capsularis]|uniref:Uncharacterized protein n=1 Tax=Corchorus capsularis TaxID=210143 RepID=A0A1R3FU43_COCAP|nr:hypothetical protein CCACVL1_31057 [Corchorus capsularis]
MYTMFFMRLDSDEVLGRLPPPATALSLVGSSMAIKIFNPTLLNM